MMTVLYTLHDADGGTDYMETQSAHVPRVGELVSVDTGRSYEVIDVLWHISNDEHTSVTITAYERDWHVHIQEVLVAFDKRHYG